MQEAQIVKLRSVEVPFNSALNPETCLGQAFELKFTAIISARGISVTLRSRAGPF